MKTKLTFWKFTTLLFAAVSVCLVTQSFNHKSENLVAPMASPEIIPDRATVNLYYQNFLRTYNENSFYERSGYIAKSTLEALLSKMTNVNDKMVYYYFGRTNEGKNTIMLFNDPAYSNPNTSNKYMTIAPFCPPNCNNALSTYVTTNK